MNSTTHDEAHAPVFRLAAMVLIDLRRVLKPLIVFEAVFKGTVMVLGTLGTAWVISPLIESTGRAAVTNTDITRFLLSPTGSLAVALLALSFLLVSMIEHLGVISIAAARLGGREVTAVDLLATLCAVALRVLSFGIAKLGMLAALCAPFVALAGLGYLALLTRHDINYYLANRPPTWYLARMAQA
jgi:glycerophosphoryl diester phosphodiesterase